VALLAVSRKLRATAEEPLPEEAITELETGSMPAP
jgi:hypothetical protein